MEEPGKPSFAGLFRSPTVLKRIQTAALLAFPSMLAIACTNPWPLYILMGAIVVVGSIELKQLLGFPPVQVMAPAVGLLIVILLQRPAGLAVPWASLIVLIIGSLAVWIRAQRESPSWLDALAFGWLAAPLATGIWLHNESLDPSRLFSPNLLILLLFPIWIGDTAAYFIGKHLGKTPLAPKISPKKTWEGAIANFLATTLTTTLMGIAFGIPWQAGMLTGVVSGTIGQFGDLLQSQLKRACQRKDSGDILPGHGGLLDRLDSFLLSSVPAAIALWITANFLFHVKH